jgi:mannose-6-phosphate isomerase-like protein (cupin superfamily)
VTRRVEKPWGHEEIWAETDRYLGKILSIRRGERLSLQLHRKKDESIYVLRGRLKLTLETAAGELEDEELEPGDARRVLPGRRHRFEAIEDTELVEVSTPEIDDVVRLQDDYGRGGDTGPASKN